MSMRLASGRRTGADEAPLVFAYREVLDATKHQEDKISRLLTAIAFLTAAVFALANLAGPEALAQGFLVGSAHVALGVISLGAFVLAVVATVIILLSSITAPLRFPGSPKAIEASDPPGVRWADEAVEASQIYFGEIARTSLAEWHRKWQSSDARLARERRDSLIRETHNLAVRTEFKYERMNEAVVVLSFGLAALAITGVLVLASVQAPPGPVEFTPMLKASLAIVLFGYVWLQLFVASRDSLHSVDDLEAASVTRGSALKRVLAGIRLGFPLIAAAVPASLVLGWEGSPVTALLIYAPLAILAWVMFFLISIGDEFRRGAGLLRGGVLSAVRRAASEIDVRGLVWAGAVAAAYGMVPMLSRWAGGYGLMLATALMAPAVLLVAGFTKILVHQRNRLDGYLKRQGKLKERRGKRKKRPGS